MKMGIGILSAWLRARYAGYGLGLLSDTDLMA